MASVQELIAAAQAQQRPRPVASTASNFLNALNRSGIQDAPARSAQLSDLILNIRDKQDEIKRNRVREEERQAANRRLDQQEAEGRTVTIKAGTRDVTREATVGPPPDEFPVELQTGLDKAIGIQDPTEKEQAFATLASRYPSFTDQIKDVGRFVLPSKPQRIALTKGLPGESAGKLASVQTARQDISRAKDLLIKTTKGKDGKDKTTINRKLIFSAAVPGGGLPFSTGRDFNSLVENALSTKLRVETGVAARPEELESIARRFKPKLSDSDETIKNKLSRLEEFYDRFEFIVDPGGQFGVFGIREKNSGDVQSLSDEELMSIINNPPSQGEK